MKFAHGQVAHFAINADDVSRSLDFYEKLFGWKLAPWGPPGFYRTDVPGASEVSVAIQARRDLLDDAKTNAFECTIAVDDVHATVKLAAELGGTVLMEPFTIPDVCTVAMIADPSGNVVGAATYV